MSGHCEITYAVDFPTGQRRERGTAGSPCQLDAGADGSIPRIARLMALALRFEGLLREGTIRDYADLARLGRVTRTRITHIMRLLDLAPDIQEQILFLPPLSRLKERNLRPIAQCLDWRQQRRRFQKIIPSVRRIGAGSEQSPLRTLRMGKGLKSHTPGPGL